MKQAKVTIYTTPTCPYCHQEKEYLKAKKIKFQEVDVASNEAAARAMVKKSGQLAVPVTEINDKIIVGFDQEALDQALGLK